MERLSAGRTGLASPTLIGALLDHTRCRPTALALRETGRRPGRVLTWNELSQAARSLGAHLRTRTGSPGPVLVGCGGRLESPVAILGSLCAERAVLPVSAQVTPSELATLAEKVGASVAIGDGPFLSRVPDRVEDRIPTEDLLELSRAPDEPRGGALAGALLLQSSGTTSLPKIVRREAAALDAVGRNVAQALSLTDADVVLFSIPLHHSYGLDFLSASIIAGCAMELHESFVPGLVRSGLLERGITVWPGVPVMLDAVSRNPINAATGLSLRRAVAAGSPLPRRVAEQFERSFGIRVGQIYGATEFGSVTYADPESSSYLPGSVGLPLEGVQVRIAPLVGGTGSTNTADEGEVVVAAPSMMQGYLDNDVAVDSGGFFRTGDLGSIDSGGRLTITGRIKLLIDVGGQKVNPLEVEEVLVRHPHVAEAVVVPVQWSDTAERHRAVIVPEPDASPNPQDLRRFARKHLSAYKVPRSFDVRADVPRSPTGKILRREIVALGRSDAPDGESR